MAGQSSAGGQAAGLFGRTRTRPLALGNLAGPQCSCNPSSLLSPSPTPLLPLLLQRAAAKVELSILI